MAKELVAFFSASGVTKDMAEKLTAATGADLFEIVPAVPYTDADLNWMDRKSRSSVEMADRSSRPKIASKLANMDGYATVYLGFPIWWYREPSIIDTFLEEYDFSGKTIVLFATSGSSGFGRTVSGLKDKVSPSAKIVEGKVVHGKASAAEIAGWAGKLKL